MLISQPGWIVPVTAAEANPADALQARLQPIIDAHAGQVAVAIKHAPSGLQFMHRADATMPTASLIKLPLMIAAYQAIDDGRVKARIRF